jgi:RNA polymerase sigma factor (sigma-70 family)
MSFPRPVETIQSLHTLPPNSRQTRAQENIIYKKFFRQVKGYYINKTKNYRLSEELAHEALHKVLKGMPSFQAGRSLENWVHGVARNNLFDYYRSLKTKKNSVLRSTTFVEAYQDNNVSYDHNSSDDSFLLETLGAILARFTELDRAIFSAHVFEGTEHEELAETHGLPVETIKNKLAYMRKKVRAQLIEA